MKASGYNSGADNGRAVLSEDQVINIRKLYLSGQYGIHELSRIFSISAASVFRIVNLESWRRVWPCGDQVSESEYMRGMVGARDGKRCAKVTHDKAVEMIMRAHAGERQSDLAEEFGVTRQNANNIVHGVQHNLAYRQAMMMIRRGESWR